MLDVDDDTKPPKPSFFLYYLCSARCPQCVRVQLMLSGAVSSNAAAPSHRRFFWQPHKLLFYYACVYVVVIRAYRTKYQIYMRNLHFKMNELLGYKQCHGARIRHWRTLFYYMLAMLHAVNLTLPTGSGDTMILIDSLRAAPPPSRLICIFLRTWKSLDIALLINLFCDTFLFATRLFARKRPINIAFYF